MQLSSKMRFIGVQFECLLGGDLWLRSAQHANAMARGWPLRSPTCLGCSITREVQANAVFAVLPADVTARLQKRFPFYVWDERTGEVRWMCAFDTTEPTSTSSPTWSAKKWPTASAVFPAGEGIRSYCSPASKNNSFTQRGIQCQWLRSQTCQPPFAKSETKSWPLPVDALLLGSCGKWTSTTHVRSPIVLPQVPYGDHPDSLAAVEARAGRIHGGDGEVLRRLRRVDRRHRLDRGSSCLRSSVGSGHQRQHGRACAQVARHRVRSSTMPAGRRR